MKVVLGGIMIAVGILIMTGSGLCSVMVIASTMPNGDSSMVPVVLIVGGVPFVSGLGLVFAGRALIRSGRRAQLKPTDLENRFR